MSNKYKTSLNFRNAAAGRKMAANYRKQFGLGLDGQPRRYGMKRKTKSTAQSGRSLERLVLCLAEDWERKMREVKAYQPRTKLGAARKDEAIVWLGQCLMELRAEIRKTQNSVNQRQK